MSYPCITVSTLSHYSGQLGQTRHRAAPTSPDPKTVNENAVQIIWRSACSIGREPSVASCAQRQVSCQDYTSGVNAFPWDLTLLPPTPRRASTMISFDQSRMVQFSQIRNHDSSHLLPDWCLVRGLRTAEQVWTVSLSGCVNYSLNTAVFLCQFPSFA